MKANILMIGFCIKAFINTFNSMLEIKDYFTTKWQRLLEQDGLLKRVTARRFITIFKTAKLIEELDVALHCKISGKDKGE